MNQRSVTLNTGAKMPIIGLGTCNITIFFFFLKKLLFEK